MIFVIFYFSAGFIISSTLLCGWQRCQAWIVVFSNFVILVVFLVILLVIYVVFSATICHLRAYRTLIVTLRFLL